MARILIGNIKGPKGDTGLQGIQGEIGPVGPQGPLPPLVNNALATEAGVAALDAAMGKTLQDQITEQNSNFPYKATIVSYYLSSFTEYGGSYYHDFTISNSSGNTPFLFSSISGANLSINTSFTGITSTAFRAWASSNAAEAIINILVLIPK